MSVDAPRDIDVPDSGQKAIFVRGEARMATVCNALEAAKREAGVNSDVDAIVEISQAYTGWSADGV